jgi:hypothetical protein
LLFIQQVKEDDYEINVNKIPGARKSRSIREKTRKGLFFGKKFYFVGETKVPRNVIEEV